MDDREDLVEDARVDKNRLTRDEWTAWGSRGVWHIPSVRANDDHEAKFPLEIPRRIIQLLTDPGDLVLDCFVGSGTSAAAATREGRRFIGVDISPESVELARKTLRLALQERSQPQFNLFRTLPKVG